MKQKVNLLTAIIVTITLFLSGCAPFAESPQAKVTVTLPPIGSSLRAIPESEISRLQAATASYRVTANQFTRTGRETSYTFFFTAGTKVDVTVECLNASGQVIVRSVTKSHVVTRGDNSLLFTLRNDGTEIVHEAPPASGDTPDDTDKEPEEKPEPVTGTVTYKWGEADNHGDKDGLPTDDKSYEVGDVFTVHDGSGMTWQHAESADGFAGWTANPAIVPADGGDATDTPVAGGKYKMPDGEVVLTAQWNKKTYQITYNINLPGGTGADGQTAALRQSPNNQAGITALSSVNIDSAALEITNNPIGSKNYTFVRWNGDDGKDYSPSQEISMLTGDLELIAEWTDKNVWTVTYVSDTQDGSSSVPAAKQYEEGETTNIDFTPPVRTGHEFVGWNEGSSDTVSDTAAYMSSGSGTTQITGINRSYTLYAVWRANTYKVNYNANNGTGSVAQTDRTYGQAFTLAAGTTLSRTGYTFAGWAKAGSAAAKDFDGRGNVPASDAYATTAADVTLYAVWIPNTYKVNYNANNGTGSVSQTNRTYGQAFALAAGTALSRTGYTFAGWAKAGSAAAKDFDGGGNVPASDAYATTAADVTLYAVWSPNTYKVNYNANNGTGSVSQTERTYGQAFTLAAGTALSRTGYTFAGWAKTDSAAAKEFDGGGNVPTSDAYATTASDVTFYAVWTPNTYTIRLNNANSNWSGVAGTFASGQATETVQATYDTATTLTAITAPNGYTFAGWTRTNGGTTADNTITQTSGNYTAKNLSTTSNETVDLYPVWQIINYKIVYNGNSNTGGTAPSATTYNATNNSVTLAAVGNLVRTNYKFLGWNTYAGATTALASLTFAQLQQQATGSDVNNKTLTLYAVWERPYTLTLNLNGGSWANPSDDKTQYSASDLTLPTPTAPNGFTFAGWSDNTNLSGAVTAVPTGTTGNKTYYAVYRASTVPTTATTTNTGGINFVAVQGGTVPLATDYMPVVSNFSISKYEITQAQWCAVMTDMPTDMATADGAADNNPVNSVSWYDAIAFCNKLSILEGKTPCYSVSSVSDWNALTYAQIPTSTDTNWDNATCDFTKNGYRLPTEAEWEYAARGGINHSAFTYSGSDTVDDVAWYSRNSDSKTHPVGDSSKTANALGISDMSGNVYEWCWDWNASAYDKATLSDPRGAASGSYRVRRGGSWNDDASTCTVAFRGNRSPFSRNSNYGLRLVTRLP